MTRWERVERAIADFREGKFVIIVDDRDRENEGDLSIAAQHATPQAINFMAREARGLICVPMAPEWADRLGLPLMVPPQANGSRFGTAFTVSVEAREGVTTGISAFDRAVTIQKLAEPASTPADFVTPGHVFPLRARPGGVLERDGQTEASVDLARLAGLHPVAVVCEIMAEDGTMARLPELERFAERHGITLIHVADLIAYRLARERPSLRVAETLLPTEYGDFRIVAYRRFGGEEIDLALIRGEVSGEEPVLVRVHSECLTGDVFGSQRCDCGEQLEAALRLLGEAGRGVLIYLRQEGRGIGLLNKLRAYHLQDQGLDTVEANLELGFPADLRNYREAALILRDLGIQRLRLLTNNPRKVEALSDCGFEIVERVPLEIPANEHNRRYLETKRDKLGHLLQLNGAHPAAELSRAMPGTHD
ncbi:bifunctional 3,4-dihydroxy-2-butanone-4-phosphate synthase/GTP cyclohydrolase II [Thermomicrobiaceae bacterium CFH 74404]|uniref:Riboflavin biosynthesis protein RibBA n=1 Tax=Thermalbibacter longus TaxID=2951981 RepID=A0AA41WB89_9BACT|nr:bifunctional 3,4-dihydroxy-2-butanone-4-phosphate synthase/GTP cyclohydrolase II [Thermalbibacter longus]MCM8748432.1 bifunctional 3,4-dihydroxy-2-butanone-4-phosphate synthase/GTP cyclohydrolase II [Thermalbibacter longus]